MNVTCYGAGVIGASWATNFAFKGCTVWVYDLEQTALSKARLQIEENLQALAGQDCFSRDQIPEMLARIHYTTKVRQAVEQAEFIQESAPEKLEVKQSIVDTLDAWAPEACIIASSTSGLRISEITCRSAYPQRYLGAHPFNPPHLIPLVELTKGEETSQETVERGVAFYRAMGKEPIVLQKEKIGYVANRLSHAVLREVMSLVSEGVCSVEDADRALVYGPGMRWGAVGQVMIAELGTQGGVRSGTLRFTPLNESIFQDLENRTRVPENWADLAEEGIARAKAEMPECIGHTTQEIAAFRDRVLVELLKLHGKI